MPPSAMKTMAMPTKVLISKSLRAGEPSTVVRAASAESPVRNASAPASNANPTTRFRRLPMPLLPFEAGERSGCDDETSRRPRHDIAEAVRIGSGDDGLLEGVDEFEDSPAAAGIELTEHVIEEDDRIIAERAAEIAGLGQAHGERRGALLR